MAAPQARSILCSPGHAPWSYPPSFSRALLRNHETKCSLLQNLLLFCWRDACISPHSRVSVANGSPCFGITDRPKLGRATKKVVSRPGAVLCFPGLPSPWTVCMASNDPPLHMICPCLVGMVLRNVNIRALLVILTGVCLFLAGIVWLPWWCCCLFDRMAVLLEMRSGKDGGCACFGEESLSFVVLLVNELFLV